MRKGDHMSKKQISKEKSIRRTRFLTELVICVVLLGTGVLFIKNAFDNVRTVKAPEEEQTTAPTEPTEMTTGAPDPDKIIFETSNVKTKEIFTGDLILVNNQHRYFGGGEDLVSILEKNDETGRTSFTAVDYDYKILSAVYEPMARMIDDFYEYSSLDDLMIYGSFRTTEFQQQLYEQDLQNNGTDSSTRVAKPGYSEHETGYAFDFSRYEKGTGAPVDYDGTGEYEWFAENCAKYGFVIRYTEEKESITEIQDEPWHFRYVGIPHAYYMMKNNLCLEEYIDVVRNHPYSGDHLKYTDDSGQEYEVYFVEASGGAEDNNSVPVPAGVKYEISGNNVDGFIVTVYVDVKNNS